MLMAVVGQRQSTSSIERIKEFAPERMKGFASVQMDFKNLVFMRVSSKFVYALATIWQHL